MTPGGEMKIGTQSLKKWLGIALVAASFAFYGCLLLVPFTSLYADRKIALSTLLVILGEGSFWLAVFILGREAMAKYRRVDWRDRLFAWLKYPKQDRINAKKEQIEEADSCRPK
jgi:hypothetical protein